jgi:hypothetical protein
MPDENSTATPDFSRRMLMHQLSVARTSLREYGIRDAPDYAEVLIAEALLGDRVVSRVTKGHEVLSEKFGRVEVKCRQLPPDGRIEERVEISASKEVGFDHLALVIFHTDFSVKGAVIVPYAVVWKLASQHQYNRLSYAQACQLAGAVDVTAIVRDAANR